MARFMCLNLNRALTRTWPLMAMVMAKKQKKMNFGAN
jgi:hypothetical protein